MKNCIKVNGATFVKIVYWQMKGDIKETFHTQKQKVTEEYRMFGLGPDLGGKIWNDNEGNVATEGNTRIAS